MEKIVLQNHAIVEIHNIKDDIFSVDFRNGNGETDFWEYLTRAECVQLAQMLLRISDTKTEGNEE